MEKNSYELKFLDSISDVLDEELKSELIESFKRYIKKRKEQLPSIVDVDKDPELAEEIYQAEIMNAIEADIDEKCRILLKDENFEKLEKMSIMIYKDAMSSIKGNEIEGEYDEYDTLKEIRSLADNVRPYHKMQALLLLEDMKNELNFILHPNTSLWSLRMIENLKRDNEK